MKKIFFSVLAIAAIAACTKSEVQYDAPQEIGFAPAVKNITKGANTTGEYDTNNKIGIFANYGVVDQGTNTTANLSSFTTPFLSDAVFEYREAVNAWGGGYTWPNNGSLIFAGYTIPKSGTVGTSRNYSFDTDVLTINGYEQSTFTDETFDLGWFGRTEISYNNRANAVDPVDVVFSHALSWIEIRAYGEGTTVADGNPWIITSIVMNNVANTGSVNCDGATKKAIWDPDELGEATNDITIFTGEKQLYELPSDLTSSESLEKIVFETNPAGTVVIPQTPTDLKETSDSDTIIKDEDEVATLTVTYKYKSPVSTNETPVWMPDQTSKVSLKVDGGWQSGTKYIYTLVFRADEILVAPSYGEWGEPINSGITVE